MGHAVHKNRMQSRVGGENLESSAGGRVAIEYTLDVLSQSFEHWDAP
jgi:hypothetical protein